MSDTPFTPHASDYLPELSQQVASFVSLHLHQSLRGCVGSLYAHQSLLNDVVDNAYAAAFRDSRFEPVTAAELAQLQIEISVLSTPQRVIFTDQQDLLRQLRPMRDGIIVEVAGDRATFLPQVWQQLPDPAAFMHQLFYKAGYVSTQWPASLTVWRYQCHVYTLHT